MDVTHTGELSDDEPESTEMSATEITMRSRLLEVRVPEGTVENVLAGRDKEKLKVQLGKLLCVAPQL